ncbi:MAG: haloacid dehalogenase type II [Pseudomonadota bacterium]
MAIGGVIFDVFGTVVDWRTGVAAEVARVFAAAGIADDAHAVADAWRAEYQPSMEAVRSGARAYTPLDALHRENLERVLAARGHAGRLDETALADLNRAWERLPPWPDAAAGIAAIRAKALVAPCSNGSIALMARLARYAGLQWDAILGADVARAYKPDPAAYVRSAAALGLAPSEVMLVAAHPADLAAARAAGLAAAYVHRPAEFGPGRPVPPAAPGDWDIVADDFLAVAEAL